MLLSVVKLLEQDLEDKNPAVGVCWIPFQGRKMLGPVLVAKPLLVKQWLSGIQAIKAMVGQEAFRVLVWWANLSST